MHVTSWSESYPLRNRPSSSQTCCTVATAPGASVVGRKQASSADQMAFCLISAVYRERFLLNGVFCSVFRLEVVRRLVWQSVGCRKRFLQLLLDVEAGRSVTGFADRRVDVTTCHMTHLSS